MVYNTIEKPHPVNKNYNGVLFFSPSAVHSFFTGNQAAEGTVFFAIGETTAKAVKNYCGNQIITSDMPAKDGLLRQAVDFFIK